MNFEYIKGFWTNTDPTLTDEILEYMLGSECPFLTDCQEAVRHQTVSPMELTEILTTISAPVPAMKKAVLSWVSGNSVQPNNLAEVDRLYQAARSVLLCTLLAYAIRTTDESLLQTWIPELPGCTSSKRKGRWTDSNIAKMVEGIFDPLLQSAVDACAVEELWDLTLYLLSQPIRPAQKTVVMRLLVVRNSIGSCPFLTLEYLNQGTGFCRHPKSLLLPSDADYQESWDNAQTCCRDGFTWNDESIRWEEGSIRWKLTSLQNPLYGIGGNSAGAAIGTGLILLLTGSANINIGITAAIDARGNLDKVDSASILPKADGAKDEGIHDICIAPSQAEAFKHVFPTVFGTRSFRLQHSAGTILELAQWIAYQSGILGAYLKAVHKETDKLDLLHGQEEIAKIYIETPILQEVEVQKLPSHKVPGGPDGSGDREEALPPPGLPRWEEAVPEKLVEYRDVPLEQAFRQNKRFVLFGPPGSGKSAVCQYVTWRMSDVMNPMTVSDLLIAPVRLRLREWEQDKSQHPTLPEFLGSKYPEPPWKEWLDKGEVLLLLDGLDEVSSHFVNNVRDALTRHEKCPAVITCRTVNRERLKTVAKGAPVYTPSPFKRKEQELYVQRYAQSRAGFKPEALLAELQRFELQSLAANPLLLSVICFVADSEGTGRLPATRTLLYEAAVSKILDRLMAAYPRDEDIKYSLTIEMPSKRKCMEELALAMLMNSNHRLLFTETEVTNALQAALERFNNVANADPLMRDLRENSRILQGRAGGDYEFIHPTFQEFLAACALQRMAANPAVGFDAENASVYAAMTFWKEREWQEAFHRIDSAFHTAITEVQKRKRTADLINEKLVRRDAEIHLKERLRFLALLDHKCWLPEWQEVFLFLAGKLNDPCPLLDLLSDPYPAIKRDDLFRHRLALAALCMAEIAPAK